MGGHARTLEARPGIDHGVRIPPYDRFTPLPDDETPAQTVVAFEARGFSGSMLERPCS
jgi:hypothetical protein